MSVHGKVCILYNFASLHERLLLQVCTLHFQALQAVFNLLAALELTASPFFPDFHTIFATIASFCKMPYLLRFVLSASSASLFKIEFYALVAIFRMPAVRNRPQLDNGHQ